MKISDRPMVVATIKEESAFQLDSSAHIFIHNVRSHQKSLVKITSTFKFQPPLNFDDVTTDGLVPTIYVKGDITRSVGIYPPMKIMICGATATCDSSFSARDTTS